jgi:GWxTD domain-containing protein
MRRILFTILFLPLAASTSYAQDALPPESNPAPKDCWESHKNWIKKDVAYIITSEEKKAFGKLKTDEDCEDFIENFWRRRDPNPDTEINEFRDEYYERIKYANENFESGIPGWMTDRGRIYIVWGKPDKVEKGYATFEENLSVPYEKWLYTYLEGIGGDVEITFIDPTETGEFRIFKPKTKIDSDVSSFVL